jgi:GAF domain-containing protein
MAAAIGYIPRSVLCLPMRSRDTLIGVIQAFDRSGGQPFTNDDQDLLGEFANEAAVAIEQSRLMRDLSQLFLVVLDQLLPQDGDAARLEALRAHAAEFAERVAQSPQYREALKVTNLVTEVSGQGPEARHLCQEILDSVAAYVRQQPTDSSARGWTR